MMSSKSIFAIFKDNLLAAYQSLTFSNSLFIRSYNASHDLLETKILVLSANKRNGVMALPAEDCISKLYNLVNISDSFDPY